MPSVLARLATVASLLAQPSWSQSTVMVDQQGYEPDISLDERWLAYTRFGGVPQVYVFDRTTGASTLVSKAPNGAPGNGESRYPSISGDGRWVAFESVATNLVAAPTFGNRQVLVHDRIAGSTVLASVSAAGMASNGSYAPSISADGSRVAFHSRSMLTPQLAGQQWVFLRYLTTGQTGGPFVYGAAQQQSADPVLTGDGRFVFFSVGVGADAGELWAYHVALDATQLFLSPMMSAFPSHRPLSRPDASFDGKYVAFLDDDWTTYNDVWLYDRAADVVERVNRTATGAQASGWFDAVRVSSDGASVAFTGYASALDQYPASSVYVRDRASGVTRRVSIDPSGQAVTVDASELALSSSARYVAFRTSAGLLLRDTLVCPGFVSYCTSSTTTHGCSPTIHGVGLPSAAGTTAFTLRVDGVEGQRMGLIFYGRHPTAQSWALGSTSYLCVFYPVQRLDTMSSGGTVGACDGEFTLDWNAWTASNPGALGQPFNAGDTFCAQGWFRDPGMPKGTNLSNGLQFTFCD